MAAVAMDAVGAAVVAGIENAHTDYEEMSGGEWLWAASEYVLTTYIAREVNALPGSKYITVEHNGTAALVDAGAKAPGPKPKKARLRGRFDLLLWWADARPRAVIEVKNQPTGPSGWFHDIERIASVLSIARGASSIKFGVFAYYYSAADGSRFSAEEKVLRKFRSVEEYVKEKTEGILHVRQLSSEIHQEGNSAWAAACLLLRPCS